MKLGLGVCTMFGKSIVTVTALFTRTKKMFGIFISMLSALFIMTILITPTDYGYAQEKSGRFGYGETQIKLITRNLDGRYLYMLDVKVCGYNQTTPEKTTCWKKTFPNHTYYETVTSNWWWQLWRGVTIDFNFFGYGHRSCKIALERPFAGYRDTVNIQYIGNGICRINN
jgi:hypothetical protein